MNPVSLASPEELPAPGSVSVSWALAVCGKTGAIYGALFGSLLGLVAVAGYEGRFLSLGINLLQDLDLADVAMASVGFAACGAITGLPSGFVGGAVYGALGGRLGALLGGSVAALTSPFGFSYLLELATRTGSADRTLVSDVLGWAPFVLAPLLALGLHAALCHGCNYFLLPAVRRALHGSGLATWRLPQRAYLTIPVALAGTASLIGMWIMLLRA